MCIDTSYRTPGRIRNVDSSLRPLKRSECRVVRRDNLTPKVSCHGGPVPSVRPWNELVSTNVSGRCRDGLVSQVSEQSGLTFRVDRHGKLESLIFHRVGFLSWVLVRDGQVPMMLDWMVFGVILIYYLI